MTDRTLQYLGLCNFGDQIKLDQQIDNPSELIAWSEEKFNYVRYNPRKPVERYGLSITSVDGALSGIPDLDSLYEYNREMKLLGDHKSITEEDITTLTPLYEHSEIKKICDYWAPDLMRSHIIRLDPGGYFPAHRDYHNIDGMYFRIIIPLKNCQYPEFTFMMEDKLLQWEHGFSYFLNTAKTHHLFNSSFNPTYFIVLNIRNTNESIDKVIKKFAKR